MTKKELIECSTEFNNSLIKIMIKQYALRTNTTRVSKGVIFV
jgi:hypothetical protein